MKNSISLPTVGSSHHDKVNQADYHSNASAGVYTNEFDEKQTLSDPVQSFTLLLVREFLEKHNYVETLHSFHAESANAANASNILETWYKISRAMNLPKLMHLNVRNGGSEDDSSLETCVRHLCCDNKVTVPATAPSLSNGMNHSRNLITSIGKRQCQKHDKRKLISQDEGFDNCSRKLKTSMEKRTRIENQGYKDQNPIYISNYDSPLNVSRKLKTSMGKRTKIGTPMCGDGNGVTPSDHNKIKTSRNIKTSMRRHRNNSDIRGEDENSFEYSNADFDFIGNCPETEEDLTSNDAITRKSTTVPLVKPLQEERLVAPDENTNNVRSIDSCLKKDTLYSNQKPTLLSNSLAKLKTTHLNNNIQVCESQQLDNQIAMGLPTTTNRETTTCVKLSDKEQATCPNSRSNEYWIPQGSRTKILERDFKVLKQNFEQQVRLEKERAKISSRPLPEQQNKHVGKRRKAKCELCHRLFPQSSLSTLISYKAIMDLQESWGLAIKNTAKARVPRCYDRTRTCRFCSQFFMDSTTYRRTQSSQNE